MALLREGKSENDIINTINTSYILDYGYNKGLNTIKYIISRFCAGYKIKCIKFKL